MFVKSKQELRIAIAEKGQVKRVKEVALQIKLLI